MGEGVGVVCTLGRWKRMELDGKTLPICFLSPPAFLPSPFSCKLPGSLSLSLSLSLLFSKKRRPEGGKFFCLQLPGQFIKSSLGWFFSSEKNYKEAGSLFFCLHNPLSLKARADPIGSSSSQKKPSPSPRANSNNVVEGIGYIILF